MSRTYVNHVLLGAGGAITRTLVPELLRRGSVVTLVSRRGTEITGTRGVPADLLDVGSLAAAVPEKSAVYLLAGLPYDVRAWRDAWPQIMENTIQVCREKECLLVFFDNVYMYGVVEGAMTEESPYRPASKKGEIRARVADRLAEEWVAGRIEGVIARSADFYGPGAEKSGIPNVLIFEKLASGKKAQWLGSVDRLHSLTYTRDCGRALPELTADDRAYNQVWHLPTAHPPLTMRRFVEVAATELGSPARPTVLSRAMIGLGGLFDRTVKELGEMLYQDERDYVFDSSKFERHFSFVPTPYEKGIAETAEYYRTKRS